MTRAGTGTVNRPTPEWARIIDRMNGATDRPSFLTGMLELQSILVAGRYGAIWDVNDQNEPAKVRAWPEELDQAPANVPVMGMLAKAAGNAIKQSASQILRIESDDASRAHDTGTHVFVTVMRSGGRVSAVSTVVADCRDDQAANATKPMRELGASLYEVFDAKQAAQELQADTARVRQAMALLAVCQEGRGFQGACLNLVNELARQHECGRVGVGWVKGQAVRVRAVSGTEHLKKHSEHVSSLELVMTECLDQQQPIVYPVPDDAEPLLAHAVVHDHRQLTGSNPHHHVLSIPLRSGDDWVGVLTLERSGPDSDPFDTHVIRLLQLVGDVVGPYLKDRYRGDRSIVVHSWQSMRDILAYLVGSKHVAWKLLGVAVLALVLYSIFGTWEYRVTAPFVLEAKSKRIIPAPYEGQLASVQVEPGDHVNTNDVLAKLRDTELMLQLTEAQSELTIATVEQTQSMAKGELAEAQQAQARADQSRARIELLEYQIDQATIRTPINGILLSGFWKDKVGGVVEQGKPMFEVAPVEELVAVVRVGEGDINAVDTQGLHGTDPLPTGRMSTRSEPDVYFQISTDRIVPLATPMDGANVFELRCEIQSPAGWLRPGMEGVAKLEIGERRIIWILTHKIVDTVRLWLWRWVF